MKKYGIHQCEYWQESTVYPTLRSRRHAERGASRYRRKGTGRKNQQLVTQHLARHYLEVSKSNKLPGFTLRPQSRPPIALPRGWVMIEESIGFAKRGQWWMSAR